MELALLPAYLWIVCSALAVLAGAARLNESLYTLTAADAAPAAALIARLDTLLPRIGLRTVLGDATAQPQPAADFMLDSPFVVKGWRWNAHSPPDEASTTWEPQGISTAADTGFARDIADGNSDVLVVSWNDVRNATGTGTEPGRGVRVSFVRQGTADGAPSNRAYAHILLVEPVADSAGGEPSFRALTNVISGGVVWRRNWLFVPDRDRGLRVFDTNHIWRVRSGGDTVGRSGSDFYGGDHALVMPQSRCVRPRPTGAGAASILCPNAVTGYTRSAIRRPSGRMRPRWIVTRPLRPSCWARRRAPASTALFCASSSTPPPTS